MSWCKINSSRAFRFRCELYARRCKMSLLRDAHDWMTIRARHSNVFIVAKLRCKTAGHTHTYTHIKGIVAVGSMSRGALQSTLFYTIADMACVCVCVLLLRMMRLSLSAAHSIKRRQWHTRYIRARYSQIICSGYWYTPPHLSLCVYSPERERANV